MRMIRLGVALGAIMTGLAGGTAIASDYPPPTDVAPATDPPATDPGLPSSVGGTGGQVLPATGQVLPATGQGFDGSVALGGVAIVAGAGLVILTRPRVRRTR